MRMPSTEPYICYGVAAVSTVNGAPYVDSQGDHIPIDELVKAAHRFVSTSRVGGLMHLRKADGSVLQIGKVSASITLKKGLVGAKPPGFCMWLFSILNLQLGDELVDLFPGTRAVSTAWHKYASEQTELAIAALAA